MSDIGRRKLKIGVGASAGGHMNQLLKLLEHSHVWPDSVSFYLTSHEAYASKLEKKGKVFVVGECGRNQILKSLKVLARSFRIILRERPDVLITTGSFPIALACLWVKVFGGKIVWIESIANVDQFSMSGRMMRPFADLFITQWPELAEKYESVEYVGALV